jgi:Zn-dependent protease with chaperone function
MLSQAAAPRSIAPSSYRLPHEQGILFLTVLLVLVVIVVTATATFCGSALFVLVMGVLSYFSTRQHHQALVDRAQPVNQANAPGLYAIAQSASLRLGPGPVEIFVVPSRQLNAYTFGLTLPKVVVLHSGLVQALDADELRFVIGHELGHVALGHTWLNSLVGGLAGIPSPGASLALLHLAFLWWNRACETSADRAGLLACGQPDKAVSALIKVGLGVAARTPDELEAIVQQLLAREGDPGLLLSEALGSHPNVARRVGELRRYAASRDYQRLALGQ